MTEETFEPTLDADLFDEEIDAEVEVAEDYNSDEDELEEDTDEEDDSEEARAQDRRGEEDDNQQEGGSSMKVTGAWSAIGAVIFGVIIADLVHNPRGTKALANAGTDTEKISVNGLLGK